MSSKKSFESGGARRKRRRTVCPTLVPTILYPPLRKRFLFLVSLYLVYATILSLIIVPSGAARFITAPLETARLALLAQPFRHDFNADQEWPHFTGVVDTLVKITSLHGIVSLWWVSNLLKMAQMSVQIIMGLTTFKGGALISHFGGTFRSRCWNTASNCLWIDCNQPIIGF